MIKIHYITINNNQQSHNETLNHRNNKQKKDKNKQS